MVCAFLKFSWAEYSTTMRATRSVWLQSMAASRVVSPLIAPLRTCGRRRSAVMTAGPCCCASTLDNGPAARPAPLRRRALGRDDARRRLLREHAGQWTCRQQGAAGSERVLAQELTAGFGCGTVSGHCGLHGGRWLEMAKQPQCSAAM